MRGTVPYKFEEMLGGAMQARGGKQTFTHPASSTALTAVWSRRVFVGSLMLTNLMSVIIKNKREKESQYYILPLSLSSRSVLLPFSLLSSSVPYIP